jgi:peptidyl-prolyl cis-trans isomerase C
MTFRCPRAVALAAVFSAFALPALAADADPVVANVNGKEIHRSALEELKQRIPQLRQVPIEKVYAEESVYSQLLDQIITGELILDQARKQKLEDDPKVKAAFKEAQNNILQQAWVAKKVDADITEAQIRARYDDLMKTAQPKEEVKARHILVDTEDAAKAVIADLKAGISFEEEAKAKTKDPSGKNNGGDLGYITKDETVPEFAEAAFKLKPGETTQAPVKTQFGWHVIKVEDRRMAPPPSYEEAKGSVRNELAQKDIQKIIEGLRASAIIKRFKADGTPMADSGKVPPPAKN